MHILSLLVSKAWAADTNFAPTIAPLGAPSTGGSALGTLTSIGNSVITLLLLIAGILAVFYLIYSGILYITSASNPDNTKKARAGIINAILGIIVIVAAFAIIRFAVGIGKCVATAENGTCSSGSITGGNSGDNSSTPFPTATSNLPNGGSDEIKYHYENRDENGNCPPRGVFDPSIGKCKVPNG